MNTSKTPDFFFKIASDSIKRVIKREATIQERTQL